ncbi:helicase protein MOM1-like [Hibiscus syriacus]|uniref:helicase protein MOM1-like n=1 Tax=Hibiscus syriacus TaxID=106335 RepID=UPI00192354DE|nr:helicase protein MOM1-like [Hibiscus syriacus]
MTLTNSSGMRKLELLEKQTENLNSMTPPAKGKSERVEKKKENASPLTKSDRGEISSSSSSSGSKRSDKSPDVLNMLRKKEKKEKILKQLTMQTVEVNKIKQKDVQAEETQKKRRDARSYRALFTKQPKKVDGTDSCNDLNGTDSERREEDVLEEFTKRTRERTMATSTSQLAEEELKRNDEHKLFPTNQKNSCKNMSSNGGDPQMSQNVLVAGEKNDDAETTTLKDLQSPQLVNSIVPGGVLDCDISVEMVPKFMPSERKGHDVYIDSVASPKMSSNDIDTFTGVGTPFASGCKRKKITETCGMYSERQRVDCNSKKQEICSSNMEERLAKYVAYECKPESSRFLEYWVPVLLSNVQLEKYCFTILSNSLSLCSHSKTDACGVLRNILVSSRKCCDHPYYLDQSLKTLLTKGLQEVEFLEVGIKSSGKLQLLDAMLWEIRKRELKVLILYQYIGGSGRDLIGDILDDFLRQRYGIDSYERVDNGVIPSKKQSALNRFNNERDRFVFLLETRACLPSIKLSAVGTVIIFGSDWSPVNDLRALQRITFDSQFEQIKVLRLYSSFTVEEKLLIFSKQDKTIDNNIVNLSPSTSHMLLKWGASYLFSQLENFHDISRLDAISLSQQSHLKDVIQEFSTILHQTGIDNTSRLSLILQAKQNQGMYRTEMPLFGELKVQVMNEYPPHTFWTKLLKGKCPRWKYSTNSQRNRKRVQYVDDFPKTPEAESTEAAKRHKKLVSDGIDNPSPKAVLQEGKLATGDREGSSGTSAYDFTTFSRSIASGSDKIHVTSTSLDYPNSISKIPALKMIDWESRRKQCDSQKNLHVLLRPQIAKLCEVLHLREDVKAMVERFLEYIMNNHVVNREPATILQAFQISLCWSASAFLNQKLDHKESVALAKQHLGFTCRKEDAEYVYSMLRCLKRMFLYRTGYLKVPNSPKASGLSRKAVERDHSDATSYQQNKKAKIEDLSGFREGSDIQTISESGVAPEIQLAKRDVLKSIKKIQKKCDKLMKKQIDKHKQEMEQFIQKYEGKKSQLENKKRTEAAVICMHSNVSTRTDKLKNLDAEYAREFDELEQWMETHLKDLEALQVAARINIQERKTRWVDSVEHWAYVELKSPDVMKNLVSMEAPSLLAPSSEEFSDKSTLRNVAGENLRESGTIITSEGRENFFSLEPSSFVAIHDESNLNKVDGAVPLREPVVANSGEGKENLVLAEALSSEKIPNGAVLNGFDGEVHLGAPKSVSSGEGYESLPSFLVPSSEEIPGGTTINTADSELPLCRPEAIYSTEGQGNIMSANCSFEKQNPGEATLNVPHEEIPKSVSEIATSCDGIDIIVCTKPSVSKEQIPDTAACSMPAEEVPLAEPETAPSEVLKGGNVQRVNDGTSPIENEQQDSVQCTMNREHDTAAYSMPAKEFPLAEPETAPSEVLKGGNVQRVNDGTSPIENDQQYSVRCTMNGVHDTSAFSIPAEEVPLAEPDAALSEVLKVGNVQRVNDGTSPIENDQQDNVQCTMNREHDTAACSMPAKEFPLTEPETAPSEVKGGNVQRENDGTSPSENDQQDSLRCTMNREHDTAACSMPAEEVPSAEPDTALSEVLKGDNVQRVNDGTSPIKNDQQDSVQCSMNREHDTVACSMPAKEFPLAEPETVPSEVLKGGNVQRVNDGTSPIENDQQDSVRCTMNRVHDTDAFSMPAEEVPLAEPDAALSEVLKVGNVQRVNDGTSLIENDQQDNVQCTMNREHDTAACSMPAKEFPLAEPETAPSEVLKGGNVQRKNDGTSPSEIDHQDSLRCTMNREHDTAACSMPAEEVPSAEPDTALSEVLKGYNVQRVNDGTSPIKNDQQDSVQCTMNREHDTVACSMPAKEFPLAEPETAPSEVLKGGNVQRENDGTSPSENDQQDSPRCTMNREHDTAACSMPAEEVPSAEPDTTLSEVLKGDNVQRVNHGTSPIKNDQQDSVQSTTNREHDTAACSMPAKEFPLAEPETVPSEVLKGGNVQRVNDGTSPIENDQQDSVPCTMNREHDTAACSMPAGDVPFAEPDTALSEVLKGGNVQRVNDGTSPIENNQQDSVQCTMNGEHGTAACSMPAKEFPLAEPETAPSEVLKGGNVQRENDGTYPSENDQQDGGLCSMNRESELREPSSDLANVNSLPYASSEVHARCIANNEMQNASQAAEISTCTGAIDVTCNMSNPDATVVEVSEQMQQLRSSESTSNLSPPDLPFSSPVEHPSNNEGQTSNQSSQAPRQPVAYHIELSDQDVLQPLDSSIDGVIDGLVMQASETRTASVPSVSNGLPLWTAPAVSSRMPVTFYHDPLQNEMERIMKEKEQTNKVYEDTKLQLKLKCDKEIEEVVGQIHRKYDVKHEEKEAEFLLQIKELDANYSKVLLNKILAEAFRSKCMDNRVSGSKGAMQEANSSFLQQLFQLSSQQVVQQHSTASGLPSTSSASSMPTVPSAVVNAHTMGPPLQVVNPLALFSGTPTRRPHISTISSSTRNLQTGSEIRAPAPHLQSFRPSSSISPSSIPLHSGGMSSQPAHSNHPAASMSLHQSNPLAHMQASSSSQSGRTQHEISRRFTAPPNPRLPSLDVLMDVHNPSGANANPPGFLLPNSSSRSATRLHREPDMPSSQSWSAQQSGGATDIICLSDDD